MRFLFVILLVCLGAATHAGDNNVQNNTQTIGQNNVLEKSHYYGVGWQRDGQHWSIEVLIDEAGGQVAYPSLECSGKWTLTNTGENRLEFIEQILEGIDDCLELGTVHLTVRQDGNLSYTWYENEPTVEARAVLVPIEDDRIPYMDLLMLTLNSINTDFMYPEYIE